MAAEPPLPSLTPEAAARARLVVARCDLLAGFPMLSAEELREAAEWAIAEAAVERMGS